MKAPGVLVRSMITQQYPAHVHLRFRQGSFPGTYRSFWRSRAHHRGLRTGSSGLAVCRQLLGMRAADGGRGEQAPVVIATSLSGSARSGPLGGGRPALQQRASREAGVWWHVCLRPAFPPWRFSAPEGLSRQEVSHKLCLRPIEMSAPAAPGCARLRRARAGGGAQGECSARD